MLSYLRRLKARSLSPRLKLPVLFLLCCALLTPFSYTPPNISLQSCDFACPLCGWTSTIPGLLMFVINPHTPLACLRVQTTHRLESIRHSKPTKTEISAQKTTPLSVPSPEERVFLNINAKGTVGVFPP